MRKFFTGLFFIAAMMLLAGKSAQAQAGLCPSNLDFEMGDFTGWECRAGSTSNNPLPITGPIPGRHTIISAATAGIDPFGFFPELCPNGSGYSVKLGNQQAGAQSESISYTYTIPSTLTVFSMLFHYAVVLESPGHVPANQPRFQARIIDVGNGMPIACVDFDFIPQTTPGGFQTSPVTGNLGSAVLYKDWTPVSINLNAYIGRTIKLEFITRDCTQTGHAGYAYVDVSTNCNGVIAGNFLCPGATETNLVAPFGFQSYEWYSDSTFTQLLATTQILNLNPPPSVGTVFPIIVNPYPGFGCRDTLYATIDIASAPPADAGPDQLICGGGQAPIGAPPVPAHTYSWSPAAGLNNPNIANPIASPAVSTEYILTVTDFLTGCMARDTVNVNIDISPPSAFQIVSDTGQCINSNSFAFTHTNPAIHTYQWDFGDGASSTSQSPVHSYASTGTYVVKLVASTQIGCRDSSSKTVTVHPMPTGTLSADSLYVCDGFPTLIRATGGATYEWYKDGVIIPAQTGSELHSMGPGVYTAVIISGFGCRSPATNSITMGSVRKPTVDFVYDKYCTGIPINFTNHSDVSGSLPVNYLWDFGNGNTSTQSNPVFVFDSAGNKTVTLSVTPQACANLITTKQITVPVEKPRPGISYFPLNAVENKPLQLIARNFGDQYRWMPSLYLSNPNSIAPVFNGVGEHIYTVSITRNSGCVTIDSQLIRIFKEADIIVPKAFTPNNDGRNDRLFPFLVGINKLKYFRILNRWGKVVFESVTDLPGWDGNVNGKPQPVDGYVWEAEGVDAYGNIIRRRGTFTLIR
jgi:gliding motility-associated-like protein